MRNRLAEAKFVEDDLPLERIIDLEVQRFEIGKRIISTLGERAHIDAVYICGLRVAEEGRIRENYLDLSWEEICWVFEGCLDKISVLMLRPPTRQSKRGQHQSGYLDWGLWGVAIAEGLFGEETTKEAKPVQPADIF